MKHTQGILQALLFSVALVATVTSPGWGVEQVQMAGAAATERGTAILTVEKAVGIRRIEDLRVAPAGDRVAFTVSEPPRGERNDRHIWVLDLKTRQARRFTGSAKSEWAPRWSPDGGRLAF